MLKITFKLNHTADMKKGDLLTHSAMRLRAFSQHNTLLVFPKVVGSPWQ